MRFTIVRLFSAVVLASCFGCAHRTFPLIRPEYHQSRQDLARQRAEEYFVKARDYDRRGLYQMAQHFYELAYELDPQSGILRQLLAEKHIQLGQFAQALVLIKGDKDIADLPVEQRRVVATLYMKMGQINRAVEALESITPLSPEEFFTLGFLYESMGMADKAVINYRRYFDSEQGHTFLVGLKMAQVYTKMGRYEDAESLYVRLDRKFEGNKAEILTGLGTLKLTAGDTARALDFFRTALIVDSTYYDAMRTIAQIAIHQGNYSEATRYYEKIFDSDDPANRIYGRTLALLYYYGKEYDKAESLLQSLLLETIDDYELHFYLGLVYAAKRNDELAAIEFKKTVALEPGFSDAWQHLCYIELRQKNTASALEFSRQYAKRFPESAAAWRTLGYVYSLEKEFGPAIKALQKAVTLDSTDAAAWFDLGAAFERDSQFAKAADAFRKVLRINPDDHQAANYLGYMWAEQGVHLDSAQVLLEFALSRDSANGAYLDSYAWIFYKKGEIEKAYEYILKAAAVITDDPVIFSHMGDILGARGDFTGAIEAYHRSIALESSEKEALEEKIRRLEERMRIPVSQEMNEEKKR